MTPLTDDGGHGPWVLVVEGGWTESLSYDEAIDVIRDLFGDTEDDTPRSMTDGFNHLMPYGDWVSECR